MRQILFVGVGSFGFHCVKRLEGRSEVTAIDRDRESIQRVGPYVFRAVAADGTRREVLEELGAGNMDAAVVSLGDKMDASILATLHLKALGVKEIFVKAISEDHAQILQMIGATRVVYPERDTAENLAIHLLEPNVLDYFTLHENIGILELVAPQEFVGKDLVQLDLRRRSGLTVIAIFRKGGDRHVSPGADCVIGEGDRLLVLGDTQHLARFQSSVLAEA